MAIVFTNPSGTPVSVPDEDVIRIDENTVAAKVDGETLFKVMPEDEEDDPDSMEAEYEEMMYDSQLNEIEDMPLDNPPKRMITWKNLRLQPEDSLKPPSAEALASS